MCPVFVSENDTDTNTFVALTLQHTAHLLARNSTSCISPDIFNIYVTV
jgi:hypothetical protein